MRKLEGILLITYSIQKFKIQYRLPSECQVTLYIPILTMEQGHVIKEMKKNQANTFRTSYLGTEPGKVRFSFNGHGDGEWLLFPFKKDKKTSNG